MVGNSVSNNSTTGRSSPMNPMAAAAVFYTRPSMSGLEVGHTNSPTMREGLLYAAAAAGFEGGSDQESLDMEANEQEHLQHVEKKRRLTVEQVKSLELSFEIENKLEPERKKQLAHELGLQPRQVAVWFQNRRARWKTKQLERDYDALKANYDALLSENKRLKAEVTSLTAKLEAKSSHGSSEVAANLDSIMCDNNNGKAMFDMEVECAATPGTSTVVVPPAATAVSAVAASVNSTVAELRASKADKEGSPYSDGYTSEILDADYPPFEQQMSTTATAASAVAAATMFQQETKQEETVDGIVYDPQQFVMIPFTFEDPANLLPNDYYLDDDQITPW